MLTLTSRLDSGYLLVTSEATGKQLAHAELDEGHDAEVVALTSFLRQFVFNSALIVLDDKQIGTWSV